MGNHCCRPQINPEPKHQVLLRLIYHQTLKQLEEPLYDSINQILTKRGYVKTLCDHLSSHKHRINPSLEYVKQKLQLTRNSKSYQSIFQMAIVSAYITQNITKISLQIIDKATDKFNEDNRVLKNKGKKKSIVSPYFINEHFKENVFEIFCETTSQLQSSLKFIPKETTLDMSIKQGYNKVLVSLVSTLFQLSNTHISAIINNVTLKNSLNTLLRIMLRDHYYQNEAKYVQRLQIDIKVRYRAMQCYQSIIRKQQKIITQHSMFSKDMIKQHLPLIIFNWLDRSKETKVNQVLESVQPEFEDILLFYFNNYFSEDNQSINTELMIIFDELKFSREKIYPIQKLMLKAFQSSDLRSQIFYRWFDYILDYLAEIEFSSVSYLDDIISEQNFSSLKYEYKNILQTSNITGCIEMVQKWLDLGILNVQNIMVYKGYKTLTSLLLNLTFFDQDITRSIRDILVIFVRQYSEAYILIIETTYSLISKIQHSHAKNDNNIRLFITELIDLTTQQLYLEVIPPSKMLPTILSIFSRLFSPIQIGYLPGKMKTLEYLQQFITEVYYFLGTHEFPSHFNLTTISQIFKFPFQYISDIIIQTYVSNRNIKGSFNQQGVSITHQKTSQISVSDQNSSFPHQQRISYEIELANILREDLYSVMINNISRWYNLYKDQKQSKTSISKKVKSLGNEFYEQNASSIQRIASDCSFNKAYDDLTFLAMAMCQYFIICNIIRKLIKMVAIYPESYLVMFHLLALIQLCSKNNQQLKSVDHQRIKNSNNKLAQEELVIQIEKYLDIMTLLNSEKQYYGSEHGSLRNSFRYSEKQEPSINFKALRLEVREYILEHAVLMVDICDSLGSGYWASALKSVVDGTEGIQKEQYSRCRVFKKSKKNKPIDTSTKNVQKLKIEDIYESQSKQIEIFEILKRYYCEDIDGLLKQRNWHKNRESGMKNEDSSAKSETYSLDGISGDSAPHSFEQIVRMVKQI